MPTVTIQQAFALALQNHQVGRLEEAETLYRQILAVQPGHAESLHRLGVVAHQRGHHAAAVQWISQSLILNPNDPSAYSNLGVALIEEDRIDEAEAAYRRALQLKPDYSEAHLNLGLVLSGKSQLEEAIVSFRRTLELRPDSLEAWYNLGTVLARRGQFDEAIPAYLRALQIKPGYPEACNNLGNALGEQGRLDEALTAYCRALELRPDYPEAHSNLGTILARQGRSDEAVAAFRRALQFRPDHAETHSNLGNALRSLGYLDEAIAAHRRALELKPDHALAYNNLGNALSDDGRLDEAIAAYRQALALLPNCGEVHYCFGTTLARQGRLDEAVAAYRRALELQPDHAEAHINLGNALKDQGQWIDAMTAYRKAHHLKPEQVWMSSNVVCALHFQPDVSEKVIAEEQQSWNRQFGEPLRRLMRPHPNDRDPERRLRLGYVSSDFRDHVVGRNLIPLLRCHDRRQFEIICYSGVVKPDSLTEEFRGHADRWRSTVRVADEVLAEMIRQDGVDILVDLAQHLAGNRLMVFAGQPAPVQVSFAGYPASTGLETIGYRISDRYLESEIGDGRWKIGPELPSLNSDLPPATKEQVYLLDSFWCYDPCGIEVEVNGLPARENGRITFGSLNNFCKINEPVLRLWARVLGKVSDSRLVLLSPAGSHRERTLEVLKREGVEARRVEFVEGCPRKEYLELYHRLDAVLDPFPYNGHTTSLDALWMGVPVVSLVGRQPVCRAGLSQLSNLGLQELVASSEDDYVGIAAQLTRDLPRLAELRRTLRPRMEASPLMDAPRFARDVEAAYRAMWRAWVGQKS